MRLDFAAARNFACLWANGLRNRMLALQDDGVPEGCQHFRSRGISVSGPLLQARPADDVPIFPARAGRLAVNRPVYL
jgi:hypothetical protein